MRMDFLNNKIIAHRGIYDNERIYENTISSIERSIKESIPLTLDISILKDNTLVCFNDSSLTKLLHVDEDLKNITLNDLNYYSKFKIATIEEALVLIRGRVPLILDIKGKSKKHYIENQILGMVKNYPGNICIQSDDFKVLRYIYKNNKNIRLGYKMNKNNYNKFIMFHHLDYIYLDSLLVSERQARKFKEKFFVIGYGISERSQFRKKYKCFNAYVCDNVLDIIGT